MFCFLQNLIFNPFNVENFPPNPNLHLFTRIVMFRLNSSSSIKLFLLENMINLCYTENDILKL